MGCSLYVIKPTTCHHQFSLFHEKNRWSCCVLLSTVFQIRWPSFKRCGLFCCFADIYRYERRQKGVKHISMQTEHSSVSVGVTSKVFQSAGPSALLAVPHDIEALLSAFLGTSSFCRHEAGAKEGSSGIQIML